MATAIELLLKLQDELSRLNKLSMHRSTSTVTAVMSSTLLYRCYKILDLFTSKEFIAKMEKFLKVESVQPANSLLPPLSEQMLIQRIHWMRIPKDYDYSVIELPKADFRKPFKRSGLILRQHIIDGEVASLFVAGVEKDSPASRAENLKYGDRILAINNIPLDYLTLEQMRYGLLEFEEFGGLDWNANLFGLASHLLNKPYHETSCEAKTVSMIVSRRRNVRRPSLNDLTEQTTVFCSLCHETVVEIPPDSTGLGLQLGIDNEENCVKIVSIVPGSPVDVNGVLNNGDRIIEVNYQNLESMSPQEVIERVINACKKTKYVQFKIIRTILTTQNGTATPSGLRKASQELIALFDERKGSAATGNQSGPTDLANTSCYEKDINYWKAHVFPGVEIIAAEYDITNSPHGLGINIEGKLEYREGSQSGEVHHYIVDISMHSPPAFQKLLLPKDELLQVNSQVLYGTDHLEVAKRLHDASPRGYLICARNQREFSRGQIVEAQGNKELTENNEKARFSIQSSMEEIRRATADSITTSDVDEFPQNQRVVYPNIHIRPKTISLSSPSLDNHGKEENGMSSDEDYKNTKNIRIVQEIERSPVSKSYSSSGFERLPMPARLTSIDLSSPSCMPINDLSYVGKLMEQAKVQLSSNIMKSDNHQSVVESIWVDEEHECIGLKLFKEAGQFLGLELEPEDGGSQGIRLACIIHNGSLDKFRKRLSVLNSEPIKQYLESYFLRPGDRIVGVAGQSFLHRPGFSARSILRRLVTEEGYIVINYVPNSGRAT